MNDDRIVGIVHNLCNHKKPIEIVALGDLHIGDRNCNMDIVNDLVDGVKSNKNRYVILAGDIMNTAIIGSKSDAYTEALTPQEQVERAADILAPIRNRILAIVPGNHEERISKTVGIDTTRTLAKILGREDVYRSTSALVMIQFGHTYAIYVNHGHGGGGRRVGSKFNALEDFAQVVDADCYVVGHTHQPGVFKRCTYRLNRQTGVATRHEQVFVNTASALSYGGYGARAGYVPGSNSYPVIYLDDKKHAISVAL